jgi:2-furoyl-CoA dehydrogenase large subunit
MSQSLGASILRKEDPALLSGRGRYADDLPVPTGTLHAHVIRSPHAHAKIVSIDARAALAQDGVWAVVTGEDVRRLSDPFLIALKAPINQWSLAVERVRYVGEPVALVVADTRYLAEDAADLVRIDYEPLDAVIDPQAARAPSALLVHPEAKSNEISVRKFSYGDTKRAFDAAHARVALTCSYPRNSFTPMECYVVVAEYRPSDDSYDVLANFQGPFSTHPVMARALRVPGPKLRLRIPPDSGGSFGIKLSVFPYIVLAALAARITGRPVKWVEDRLEHLVAASSGPNRITEIEAAVAKDGRILALRLDQLEDYGAFLRAPMPGPLYRMHGAVTGAYDIANVDVVNRVVLTNKMPASLIRGFGGPQLYLALERLVQRIAIELRLDHLEVIKRNLVPAKEISLPGRRRRALRFRRLSSARSRPRPARGASPTSSGGARPRAPRDDTTASDFAAVVEPGMSNMGYLSTLLTPEARDKGRPQERRGVDGHRQRRPLGAVSVTADVTVQGQGHQTVLAQIVADRLGLSPADINVGAGD